MRRSYLCVICAIIWFFPIFCNQGVNTSVLNVEPKVNLNKTLPSIQLRQSLFRPLSNCFAPFNGHIFALDIPNHRVIKLTLGGKLLESYGGIGQSNDDLYYPYGIHVSNKTIYILDKNGKHLKRFSTDGKFISSTLIEKNFGSTSIFVNRGLTYINNLNPRKKQPMMYVLNNTGEVINQIGEKVTTRTYLGDKAFNTVFLTQINSEIYGAYMSQPKIFKFNRNGDVEYMINLPNLEIIRKIKNFAEEHNVDSPSSIKDKSGRRISYVYYCSGLASNLKDKLYYSVNHRGMGTLIIIEPGGKVEKLFNIQIKNKPAMIKGIFYESSLYVFLFQNPNLYLANIKKEEIE